MRGEPLLLALCILIMTIEHYNPIQFPHDDFKRFKQSRCSYQWENTPVGGGFKVPFSELGKKKSVPQVPNSLKKKGIKYEYATLPEGAYLFYRVS